MVGQRKNKADRWMPPRVYRGRSRYEYRPKDGRTVNLCKLPADGIETEALKAQVWAEYAREKEKPVSTYDVTALVEEFHASPQFKRVSGRTQEDYARYSKRIVRVFGHMQPDEVEPHHVRSFMDALAEQKNAKGEPKIVTANRHHSYISVLFAWGVERNKARRNPASGVRKFKETPRDRYIEDWEYDLVLRVARESSYPYIAPMMEIGYLCRTRPHVETRALTEADVKSDGLFIDRAKGSMNEVTGWSPRLKAAIDEARSLYPDAPTSIERPLIRNRKGYFVPRESVKTAWQRIMREALRQGLKERFTMHDIKAKGVTDHDKKASGHRNKKMQAVYDRKPGVMEPTR